MKRRFIIACAAAHLATASLASTRLAAAASGVPADPFAHPVTDDAQLRAALARPAAKLAKAQVLTGRFRHARHLSEIPRPLIATGEFTFVRDLGVYWHTQQPFDSVVVLTSAGLVQSDGGAKPMRLGAEAQPAVRVIANIFMALFTLDVPLLTRDFTVYGGKHEDGWIIGLRPRNANIAGVFAQATVAGSEDVEQVVLTDARGDRTVIDLSAVTYSNDPPGAGVRALFAPARP
jgi:outer membrane lipoprotein carrier protein LolA